MLIQSTISDVIEIEGPFEVSLDGNVKIEEKDGIDYAAVTVQLPGGEREPFLFLAEVLYWEGGGFFFANLLLSPVVLKIRS